MREPRRGPYAPYYQSQRAEIYRAAIDRLLAEEKAFKDFDPPEVVQQDRAEAEAAKRNYVNIRRSLELTPEKITELEAAGTPYVVRLLVPRDQSVTIHDAVRGSHLGLRHHARSGPHAIQWYVSLQLCFGGG